MSQKLTNLKNECRNMGVANTLLYIAKSKMLRPIYNASKAQGVGYRTGTLQTNQLQFSVLFRYNSSDVNVFSQIFVADEYRPLNVLKNVKCIIDCGAYVGYSTAYFLSRFPEARVIAVEPDKRNYELLKQNLEPYGERVKVINAAVWRSRIGVKVSKQGIGEEGEWVTSVRECREEEERDLDAVDIETLLDQCDSDTIDILKIDIEGAESVVFSGDVDRWVKKVRAFAIELHNEECRQAFHRALGSEIFSFSSSGEITIAQRR
jgi:FkbM family methyltransferase